MFCRKCGINIPNDSSFCPSCGSPVMSDTSSSSSAVTQRPEYTLTIDRASQMYLINPPIKATIDGSIRLNIENGQTASINISAGNHTIEFKSSFRSTSLDIQISGDTLIEVSWNRITGKLVANVV